MRKGIIEIISDDYFVTTGLLSLILENIPVLFSSPVMIIDIDRISNLSSLEGYIRRASASTVISGLSRNGIMSRLLSQLPSVSIDAPLAWLKQDLSHLREPLTRKSFWLAQCQAVRTGQRLTPVQTTVLSGFGQGLDLHRISRATGIPPKTCYSHVGAITTSLNLRNITELRYFATRLLEGYREPASTAPTRWALRAHRLSPALPQE
ncbi:hypothetical protein DW184_24620 [Enterobacter cloacae]|uniref:helix-turn-helix transcriptional regulator n=1 Tax=Enterobacter cloacae TaxID=550 RepID=UPI000E46D6ED|nr:response regulator transcription factor [Enterobacter cloacae]RHH96548.1 hypothetical protein DW184_24620 [Enterobacter cloacae]